MSAMALTDLVLTIIPPEYDMREFDDDNASRFIVFCFSLDGREIPCTLHI